MELSQASAPGPLTCSSPMCETSNRPACCRTARTSSMTPAYCTGISHPANGTSRAPSALCRSYSGVRFNSSFIRSRSELDSALTERFAYPAVLMVVELPHLLLGSLDQVVARILARLLEGPVRRKDPSEAVRDVGQALSVVGGRLWRIG